MKDPTQVEPGLSALLWEIYDLLSPRRKRHLYLLLGLMLLGAVAELATLGSLLPFLSLLAGVAGPTRSPSLSRFFAATGATSPSQQIFVAATLFAAIALTAGAIRLALSWSTYMFKALLGDEVTREVQRRILMQPYAFHLERNSSQAVAAIETVDMLVTNVLVQLIYAIVAGFIALAIVATLIYVEPFAATITAAAFSLLYLLVSAFTRRPLARNSKVIRAAYEERIRIVQESIGGIRDVIIDGAQRVCLDTFARVTRRYNLAIATTNFFSGAPRFIIEAVGMAAIAMVAMLIAYRAGGFAAALPLLGAVALGAQRLLPLLQQVYHGWASISGHRSLVAEVLSLLKLPAPTAEADSPVEPLSLEDKISIEQVSFSYRGSRQAVLDKVSFDVPRGSMVGLVGKTGSGKSTLADLIMGLIEPTAGKIAVDGVALEGDMRLRWQRSIAHVPQSIFLSDTSIARNIAFGVPPERIDDERVKAAAATAQLHDFVMSLPEGYLTKIGERGIRLSGGQRQRLGIARAIYKATPVLVLDEATSALDNLTEAAVMRALEQLGEKGRTIIVIAHRLSTLTGCDFMVRLEDGRAVAVDNHAHATH